MSRFWYDFFGCIFRKLASAITTGCHLRGQFLPWWSWDSMNLWHFWGTCSPYPCGFNFVSFYFLGFLLFTPSPNCLFSSFMGRNPLYLGVIFVAFLLVKALWVQLDISGEFRNGAVSFKLSRFILWSLTGGCKSNYRNKQVIKTRILRLWLSFRFVCSK